MGTAIRDAKYWIEKLELEPHPEGGYFRQTYKSELRIVPEAHSFDALRLLRTGSVATSATRVGQPTILEWGTKGLDQTRAASTAIYFLLEGENFSAFHRLKPDEMWHFYTGSPLVVHVIDASGKYSTILLGNDPEAGQVFQAVVVAGCWFAAHVQDWRGWALVGCTVAPGFEFADFELGKKDELVGEYPQHRGLIERLTRK